MPGSTKSREASHILCLLSPAVSPLSLSPRRGFSYSPWSNLHRRAWHKVSTPPRLESEQRTAAYAIAGQLMRDKCLKPTPQAEGSLGGGTAKCVGASVFDVSPPACFSSSVSVEGRSRSSGYQASQAGHADFIPASFFLDTAPKSETTQKQHHALLIGRSSEKPRWGLAEWLVAFHLFRSWTLKVSPSRRLHLNMGAHGKREEKKDDEKGVGNTWS